MPKRDIESKQSVLEKNWEELLSGKYDRNSSQRTVESLTPQEDTDEERNEFTRLMEQNLEFIVEKLNEQGIVNNGAIYQKLILHYVSNYYVSPKSFEKIMLMNKGDSLFISLFHNSALPISLLLSDKLTKHIDSVSRDMFLGYLRKRIITNRWDEVLLYRKEMLVEAGFEDAEILPAEWIDKIIGWDGELFDD